MRSEELLDALASQIGLLAAFRRVPFPMKKVAHRPANKLGELVVHILAGGMHVKGAGVRPPAAGAAGFVRTIR